MNENNKLVPRWGQPLTGIIAVTVITLISLLGWWLFADIRGPLALYQDDGQPFFMIVVWILVAIHVLELLFDGKPYSIYAPGPKRALIGITVTLALAALIIAAIQYFWGKFGLPFLSWPALKDLGVTDWWSREVSGLSNLILGVTFLGVLLFWKIAFQSWPFDNKLAQPVQGFATLSIIFTVTTLFYTVVMYPFFGLAFDPVQSYMSARPWWTDLADTVHVNFNLGWWQWCIVFLFMTATIWLGKPFDKIQTQPARGIVTIVTVLILTVVAFKTCLVAYEILWGPAVSGALRALAPYWRYLHVAEQAGFVLFPMVALYFYFDNWPNKYKPELNWLIRTITALGLGVVLGIVFYKVSGPLLGIPGGAEISNPNQYPLLWVNWWITMLLFNVWLAGKWPFYKESSLLLETQQNISA